MVRDTTDLFFLLLKAIYEHSVGIWLGAGQGVYRCGCMGVRLWFGFHVMAFGKGIAFVSGCWRVLVALGI